MIYFRTQGGRTWSPWIEWAKNTKFLCCCCGLGHNTQIRVMASGKHHVRVEVRMRENKTFTKKRRSIMKRAGRL